MSPQLQAKFEKLSEALTELSPVAVAFSGGVDSTFLLAVAIATPGVEASAVMARSVFLSQTDEDDAVAFCAECDIPLVLVEVDPLADPEVAANPPERCYVCKRLIFEAIREAAGDAAVVDGTNADDTRDYRPGIRALRELDVRSPLEEAGLTKADIRALSAQLGLPTADKPSAACLASRIPYGECITPDKLARIDAAESLLKAESFTDVRVRFHGDLARIEVAPEQIARFADADLRDRLTAGLRGLGFSYVTLDLDGYRLGSLNETLMSR